MSPDRQLLAAAAQGNTQQVQASLKLGASPHATGPHGRTPLHAAAAAGHLKVVHQLIRAKAVVDARTTKGHTPLHLAALHGHKGVAAALMAWRASAAATDHEGCTPLQLAAGHGRTELIRTLVECGADVNAASTCGWTALHWASDSGRQAAASQLLVCGAAVDSADSQGRTALHLSSWKGHLALLGVLLCGGASPAAIDGRGWTPLLFACSAGRELALVELLRCGALPDACDGNGNTALHLACRHDSIAVTSRLLQVPLVTTHINATNHEGHTPVYLAAKEGRLPVLQLLLKYHASMEVRAHGLTPLHAALEAEHVSCVEALLAAGADADALYGAGAVGKAGVSIVEGTNPLQRAVQLRCINAVPLLATPTNLQRVCQGEPPEAEDEELQQVLQLLGYGPQHPADMVLAIAHGIRCLLEAGDSPMAAWRLERVVSCCAAVRGAYGAAAAAGLLELVFLQGRLYERLTLAMQLLRGVHSMWLAAMPWLRQKWGITYRLQQLVLLPLQLQRQQQDPLKAAAGEAAGGGNGAADKHPEPVACTDLWPTAEAAADAGDWRLYVQNLEQLTGLDSSWSSAPLYDVAVRHGRAVQGVIGLCGALLEAWWEVQQQPSAADEVMQEMRDGVLAAVQAWEQRGPRVGGSSPCQ